MNRRGQSQLGDAPRPHPVAGLSGAAPGFGPGVAIGLFHRRLIGGPHLVVAIKPGAHRIAQTVGQLQGQHGSGHPVGNQPGLLRHQFGPGGQVDIGDGALQGLPQLAGGIPDMDRQKIVPFAQVDSAPFAHRHLAVGARFAAVEIHPGNRRTIQRQAELLPALVLDRQVKAGQGRNEILPGPKPAGCRWRLQQPVGGEIRHDLDLVLQRRIRLRFRRWLGRLGAPGRNGFSSAAIFALTCLLQGRQRLTGLDPQLHPAILGPSRFAAVIGQGLPLALAPKGDASRRQLQRLAKIAHHAFGPRLGQGLVVGKKPAVFGSNPQVVGMTHCGDCHHLQLLEFAGQVVKLTTVGCGQFITAGGKLRTEDEIRQRFAEIIHDRSQNIFRQGGALVTGRRRIEGQQGLGLELGRRPVPGPFDLKRQFARPLGRHIPQPIGQRP